MRWKTIGLAALVLGNLLLLGGLPSSRMFKQSQVKPTEAPAPVNVEPSKPASHGITEIGIDRTPCFGTCPAYKFVAKSDGSCQYHGEMHVARLGDFTGKVSTWKFERLAEFIVHSHFTVLPRDGGGGGNGDEPTIQTTIVMDGERVSVGSAGTERSSTLWAIDEAIDHLMCSAEWDVPAGAKREPVILPGSRLDLAKRLQAATTDEEWVKIVVHAMDTGHIHDRMTIQDAREIFGPQSQYDIHEDLVGKRSTDVFVGPVRRAGFTKEEFGLLPSQAKVPPCWRVVVEHAGDEVVNLYLTNLTGK